MIQITAEEAVARLINFHFLPATHSLLDMTSAFVEDAETNYENARIEGLSEKKIAPLRLRFESCQHRHQLATLLLEQIGLELKKKNESVIISIASKSKVTEQLDWNSIEDWSAERFGITASDSKELADPITPLNIPAIKSGSKHNSTKATSQAKTYSIKLENFIKNGFSRTSSLNLLVTLSLFLDEFASKDPDIFTHKNNALNIDAVAKELEAISEKFNSGNVMKSQSHERIKDRLEAAIEARLNVLNFK